VPEDISGARDLARRGREDGRYYFEFEKWALSLIAAQPGNQSKRGADKGIDGNIYFDRTKRAIVSVKAGDNVSVAMIRDLRGVIEREGAETVRGRGLRAGPPHPDRSRRPWRSATAPCACRSDATTPSGKPPDRGAQGALDL
jgi:hypothetical protein